MSLTRSLAALCAAAVVALASAGCGSTTASPASPAATPAPGQTPTASPTPGLTYLGTAAPDEGPDRSPVAATTNGVLFPWYEAESATRHPIAVMIDDQIKARPQSGLSQADIVYQAPAEGGVPRYMAIFQTQLPESVGPIRSTRLYFVVWAEEWDAMYVHMLGAPNAINRLYQIDGKTIYNADARQWLRYYQRVTYRVAPHNLYTTSTNLRYIATKLGATAPFTQSPFVFADDPPPVDRPAAGMLVVPYHGNTISYRYDRISNTYPRSVAGEDPQIDFGNKAPIAPSNVIVLYQEIGLLPVLVGQASKNRLEIQYLGSGKATVYNNGRAIDARWSKATESSPTLLTYASGPLAGQPVPMVRGQIFIQVVPLDLNVTWKAAGAAALSPSP